MIKVEDTKIDVSEEEAEIMESICQVIITLFRTKTIKAEILKVFLSDKAYNGLINYIEE